MRVLYIVRDFRVWIYLMLYSSKLSFYFLKNVLGYLVKLFKIEGGKGKCNLNSGYVLEYELLRKELLKFTLSVVFLLVYLWFVNIVAVLRINTDLLFVSY